METDKQSSQKLTLHNVGKSHTERFGVIDSNSSEQTRNTPHQPAMVSDPEKSLHAVDLQLLLNEESRFLAAAMLLCNELKARFNATQVSFGWISGRNIRLRAVSNTQKFDRKHANIRKLQYAMEECLDQNEEVIFPMPRGNRFVVHEHSRYSELTSNEAIVSLPMRDQEDPFAVLTLERNDQPFTPSELLSLRLLCDLVSKRLHDMEKQDQWFGRKIWRSIKSGVYWCFGLEHTWTKLGILAGIAVIALLFLWPWNYRVEAPCLVRTENIVHLPAPFDGFIEIVNAEIGDVLNENDSLLSLDKRELLLQEMESQTKLKRHEAEAASLSATGRLNEAKLARLQMQEEAARLDLIQHRLAIADLRAPVDGIVVNGDLKEKLGAPVNKGDALFKMARIEDMTIRLEVDERDIHEMQVGSSGEFALTSRPEIKYRMIITQIDPTAIPNTTGSIFYVYANPESKPEEWWRPGMNGVAKIDVGERSIFWVLTHRLVDFLHMKLWL